jgi:exonuclease III
MQANRLIGDYFPVLEPKKKEKRQRTYLDKQNTYIIIASVNTNGKITDSSRKEGRMLSTAIALARRNGADLLALQETKTTHEPFSRRNNWHTTAVEGAKWGVATTAVNRSCKISSSATILEGRIIQTTVEKNGTSFNLLNCYFPPDAAKKKEAVEAVANSQYTGPDTVMIGDLNIMYQIEFET